MLTVIEVDMLINSHSVTLADVHKTNTREIGKWGDKISLHMHYVLLLL